MNTPTDELALRNLMARYVDAANRYDADDWIATWAEDAQWHLLEKPARGRSEILALWREMMASFEFALMLPGSCLFHVEGDSAHGHWYLHEYVRDRQGTGSTIVSRYDDQYVKQNNQWLFKSRHYKFLYQAPGAT
jgi:ketosteroid isomerase-like protein